MTPFPNTLVRMSDKYGDALFIEKASFKDGPGYTVKSVSFTRNVEKAARFRAEVAEEIAKQYFTKLVALTDVKGTVTKDFSAEFRPMAEAYHKANRDAADDFNKTLHDAIKASDPALLDMLFNKALHDAIKASDPALLYAPAKGR